MILDLGSLFGDRWDLRRDCGLRDSAHKGRSVDHGGRTGEMLGLLGKHVLGT